MKGNNRFGSMALALMLVLNWPALPAAAQDRSAVPPPQKEIRLPCCRCLDGKSTSVNASTGTAPWNVAFGTSAAQPVVSASNVSWTPVPPGKWVGPAGSANTGAYTFQMPFQVPNCVIPMQVTISGKFAADNSGKLYIDRRPRPVLEGHRELRLSARQRYSLQLVGEALLRERTASR